MGLSGAAASTAVIWHDVECGSYAADLPLWRALAARAGGPVRDVGAGPGRVAIDLHRRGVDVHALDVDGTLLEALRQRAPGVPTHEADARDFSLPHRFALVIAPMQTVQLLGGPAERRAFLRSAQRHLEPRGLLAAALANTLDDFEEGDVDVEPDMRDVGGVVYASRPTAVRSDGDGFVLERVRERVDLAGDRSVEHDRIRLDRVSADRFNAEAAAAGFTPLPPEHVDATEDHVGSEVAILRA